MIRQIRIFSALVAVFIGTHLVAIGQVPEDATQRSFGVVPAEVLEEAEGVRNRYALLVGISEYENSAINLNYADDDAQAHAAGSG